MTTISTIHTPCKNCCFAIYNDKTQTDCGLNYIAKFRSNNVEIIEAYDEEKEFYVINGKKCIGFRDNKWVKKFNLEEASIEDKIAKFKEINSLDYLTVVDLSGFSETKDLEDLCSKLSQLNVKTKKIIFIRHRDQALNQYSFKAIEEIIKSSNLSCLWRIQSMVDDSIPFDSILRNIVTLNMKYRFILSIIAKVDNLDIINTANKIVHEDLDQFMILANEQKTSILFSGAVYRFAIKNNEDILMNESLYKIV